jgi:hypothetical protein
MKTHSIVRCHLVVRRAAESALVRRRQAHRLAFGVVYDIHVRLWPVVPEQDCSNHV